MRVRKAPVSPVVLASRAHLDRATREHLARIGCAAPLRIGSSLKFALIASGEADLYPRFGPTMEWDTAAGDAILRAAGGSVTTLDGRPLAYGKNGFRNPAFVARGG